MAISVLSNNFIALSGNTEWSFTANSAGPAANTVSGVYQIFVDTTDMIANDQIQLRVYEKCSSGAPQRIVYQSTLSGSQGEPMWVTPSLILMHGWDATANLLTGGTMNVCWSIRQVA
jgi:hypothetical protein